MALADRLALDAGKACPTELAPAVIVPGIAVDVRERGVTYRVRKLAWNDGARHAAFQRLRGEVFVRQLGWPIPLEPDGREADRYDIGGGRTISVHCVYGLDEMGGEHLLAGLRIFTLRTWDDAMLTHEFSRSGMIPAEVLAGLRERFAADELLELTRLCLAGRRVAKTGADDAGQRERPFDLAVARDLCYAAAIRQAVDSGRDFAIAIVDGLVLRAMRRTHFVLEPLYAVHPNRREGYTLVLVDLAACITAVLTADGPARANRFLALCPPRVMPWLPA